MKITVGENLFSIYHRIFCKIEDDEYKSLGKWWQTLNLKSC